MFIKGGRQLGHDRAAVDLELELDDAHRPIVEAVSVTDCIEPFTLFSQNAFSLGQKLSSWII